MFFAGHCWPIEPAAVGNLRGDAIAMTTELRMLAFSIVLGFVHIILASHAKSNVYGYRWSAGPRDQAMPPLPGVAGRLDRALRNFGETFPLFAAAVLVAQFADRHNASRSGARSSISGGVSPISRYTPLACSSFGRWHGTWLPLASFSFCWAFFDGPFDRRTVSPTFLSCRKPPALPTETCCLIPLRAGSKRADGRRVSTKLICSPRRRPAGRSY